MSINYDHDSWQWLQKHIASDAITEYSRHFQSPFWIVFFFFLLYWFGGQFVSFFCFRLNYDAFILIGIVINVQCLQILCRLHQKPILVPLQLQSTPSLSGGLLQFFVLRLLILYSYAMPFIGFWFLDILYSWCLHTAFILKISVLSLFIFATATIYFANYSIPLVQCINAVLDLPWYSDSLLHRRGAVH